jgi:uncharacterized protein
LVLAPAERHHHIIARFASMIQHRWRFFIIFLFLICVAQPLRADEQSKSLAFKNQYIQNGPFTIKRYDYTANLVDAFMVVQKANSGDPIAQHDLGLRYLTGTDFVADTVKACYWIRKASEQHIIPAQYNYGILLNNGWGTAWNPFEAYRQFRTAAMHGMVEAEYVTGIFLTDNLVAPKNFNEAYRWIKAAADSGYAPAKDVLNEFARRGLLEKIHSGQHATDSSQPASPASPGGVAPGLKPIFLDFSRDSVADPDDHTLLKDALAYTNKQPVTDSDTMTFPSLDSLGNYRTILSLYDAAEAGNPEALTMLGRSNEKGMSRKKDVLQAALYYVRASRFDSPWAPMLLWKMIHRDNFFDMMKHEVETGNPTAEYIWAMLISLDLDNQITEPQALQFLEHAAKQNYLPAVVEMGLCLYTGRWVKQDKQHAIEILQRASEMGSKEAVLQLCAIELRDQDNPGDAADLIQTLQQFTHNGSVLAETVLGYCYQSGRGVDTNLSESVRLYRRAAARGSQIAYHALRALYDNIRPNDSEFKMNDE